MRSAGWDSKPGVEVLAGRWQEHIPRLLAAGAGGPSGKQLQSFMCVNSNCNSMLTIAAVYDAVYFDTYAGALSTLGQPPQPFQWQHADPSVSAEAYSDLRLFTTAAKALLAGPLARLGCDLIKIGHSRRY